MPQMLLVLKPLFSAMTLVDGAVVAVYLLIMLAVGLFFSRQQRTSRDFFLAGRTMSWFPVGLSVMATLLSALSYTGIPGEGYYEGLRFLLSPLAVWLTLPVIVWVVVPLYHRLELYSIYEYLELRFDATTRLVSSGVFVLWRLLWLGVVLYAPCKVLVVAAGLDAHWWITPALIVAMGLVGTAYTFLGGMKAVIWTDVIQSLVMLAGVVLLVAMVWMSVDGGPARVWEVAESLGRTTVFETKFDWARKWSMLGILPHFFLSMLSFYVADQITAQRFLTAKDLLAARRSFVLNCLSVSIMIPALAYVGMSLLAFYHDHPREMNAKWVVNVDGQTRQSITRPETRDKVIVERLTGREKPDPTSGTPLVDWQQDKVTVDTIRDQVAEGRILRPNVEDQPFESSEQLIVRDESGEQRIAVERLAKRDPTKKGKLKQAEIILHQNAQDELMPRFFAHHLPVGMAGLVLAGLLAASMSSLDSGLNSICTLLVTDFHRRLGWGRRWLAARLKKDTSELTEQDELKLGRPLVLLIGVSATAFALLVAQIGNIFDIMIGVVNTFGGPLLAVFLLGMFTRRVTSRAALAALLTGTFFMIALSAGVQYGEIGIAGLSDGGFIQWSTKVISFVAMWMLLLLSVAAMHSIVVRELKQGGGLVVLMGLIVAGEALVVFSVWSLFQTPLAFGLSIAFIGAWLVAFATALTSQRWLAIVPLTIAAVTFTAAAIYRPSLLAGGALPEKLNNIWPLFFGVAFTVGVGYSLSFVLGREKTREELRGLVVGVGELGVREVELAPPEIDELDDNLEREERWK